MKKTIVFLSAVAVLSLALPSCAMEGQVLEEGTNKPIEGALVVAIWKGSQVRPAHASTICYLVKTTTTDVRGKYRILDFSGNLNPFIADRQASIESIYKSGYHDSKQVPSAIGVDLLAPHAGTQEQQFEQIGARVPYECSLTDEGKKSLLPLMRLIYEEMKSNAKTSKQLEEVEGMLSSIESVEFGLEVAYQRQKDRQKKK